MDWKEALLAHSKEMGIDPENLPAEETLNPDAGADPGKSYLASSRLHILMERKGRAGKTATIIEGFGCDGAELKLIATRLKQRLGTGGSVRGSEILVQGDRRRDVAEFLESLGFRHISVG